MYLALTNNAVGLSKSFFPSLRSPSWLYPGVKIIYTPVVYAPYSIQCSPKQQNLYISAAIEEEDGETSFLQEDIRSITNLSGCM